MDLSAITSALQTQLGQFEIPAEYGSWIWVVAGTLGLGIVTPLIGAVTRLGISIAVQTIRAPLGWLRGISNELARIIYYHGPGFTRVIARPLAVVLLVSTGYIVSTQLEFKKSAAPSVTAPSKASTDCTGEIVPLNCPRQP